MRDPTYESVEPLLVEKGFGRQRVECLFECPVSGARVEAVGDVEDPEGALSQARYSFFRRMFYQLHYWIGNILEIFLPIDLGWRTQRDLGDTVGSKLRGTGAQFSDEQVEAAVVDAFETAQHQFIWVESSEQWVAKRPEINGLDEASEGWLARQLKSVAQQNDGKVVDPTHPTAASNYRELRFEVGGSPARLYCDRDYAPTLEVQLSDASERLLVEYRKGGLSESDTETDDPWAVEGASPREVEVADNLVARREESIDTWEAFPTEYREKVVPILQEWHGELEVDSDGIRIRLDRPINRVSSPKELVDELSEVGASTVSVLSA